MKIKDTLTHLVRTLTRRGGERTDREMPVATTAEPARRNQESAPAHHPRRDSDIPFDRIEGAYTPTQTSLKAPFRASGDDHQRDQEFARGVDDGRWNDEDRFTNKSGDPRIGTHGRTYEPGEAATPAKNERLRRIQMEQNRPNPAGFGTTTGSDRGTSGMTSDRSDICPTCGHSKNANLEHFLGRLGINDDMINTLKLQMRNVDVEDYINTARDYLKTGGDKATKFAKENPGKIAAGVAALAVGAGLLLSSLSRE